MHLHVSDILTLVVVGAWLASFVIRVFNPTFPAGAGVDAAMLLIIGWWFSAKAVKKRNGES